MNITGNAFVVGGGKQRFSTAIQVPYELTFNQVVVLGGLVQSA